MPTIQEIWDNPELAPEEKRQFVYKAKQDFAETMQSLRAFEFPMPEGNTEEVVAGNFYTEHFIMAGVLEAFVGRENISYKELNESICNYIPHQLLYDLPASYISQTIVKTVTLGYIEAVDTGDKYMPEFRILDKGKELLTERTLQTLASSSFFNFQAHRINSQAGKMNKRMFIVTICSVVVAMIALVYSFIR